MERNTEGSPGNKALFLDPVGTLLALDETRQLPLGPDGAIRLVLMPNVAARLAPERDRLVFVVTNQAGVARGRLSLAQLEQAMAELDRLLGMVLTGWRICPHDEGDGCPCRKPRPAMLLELAADYGVDMAASLMVGDQEVDRQTAANAGVGGFAWAADFFGWNVS